jgi:hypothetical protein
MAEHVSDGPAGQSARPAYLGVRQLFGSGQQSPGSGRKLVDQALDDLGRRHAAEATEGLGVPSG